MFDFESTSLVALSDAICAHPRFVASELRVVLVNATDGFIRYDIAKPFFWDLCVHPTAIVLYCSDEEDSHDFILLDETQSYSIEELTEYALKLMFREPFGSVLE